MATYIFTLRSFIALRITNRLDQLNDE